jgi:hypothetical protein
MHLPIELKAPSKSGTMQAFSPILRDTRLKKTGGDAIFVTHLRLQFV